MSPELIDALSQFSDWGTVALPALMLVLVVIALTLGTLTELRYGLLSKFMYIGAFCFVVALISQFFSTSSELKVVISVLPNDLDGNEFPEPYVKLNGVVFDRNHEMLIKENAVISIDVNRAFQAFREEANRATQALDQAEAVQRRLDETSKQLQAAAADRDFARQTITSVSSEYSTTYENLIATQKLVDEQERAIAAALEKHQQLIEEITNLEVEVSGSPFVQSPVEDVERLKIQVQQLNQQLQTGLDR